MIIIKNIILYFIQIRHTDDFPSTGTRLVSNNVQINIFNRTEQDGHPSKPVCQVDREAYGDESIFFPANHNLPVMKY